MKSICFLLITLDSGFTSTSRFCRRMRTPSKTRRIISDGVFIVFSSTMSLAVIDLTASSASRRYGRAACKSLFASSCSRSISSLFLRHSSRNAATYGQRTHPPPLRIHHSPRQRPEKNVCTERMQCALIAVPLILTPWLFFSALADSLCTLASS